MPNTPTTRLDNAISGDRAEQLASDLGHQKSRLAIQDVVAEYVASTVFAERVKKIQLESLESTVTYKKISDKVQTQIETTLSTKGVKNRNFVIPMIISSVAALAAIAAVVVTIVK